MTLVLAAKRFTLGRILPGRTPIPHYRQFHRTEKLKLPHA
jgi:hypothetical protein